MTRTYLITGPDANGQYIALCQEEPGFSYEAADPQRAVSGLIWVLEDNSPVPDESDD